MLTVYYGDRDDVIYNTNVYFNNTYQDEWLLDPFCQEMIRAVDKGEVIGPNCIETWALGPIPPTTLSGGVKTLMLIHKDPEHIFNASACGDNCAPWLLKIGEHEDRTINLYHLMDFGDGDFKIKIANNGIIVHNMAELVVPAHNALRGDNA